MFALRDGNNSERDSQSSGAGTHWRPVGDAAKQQGSFTRFDRPGQAIDGTWLGWRPGPFGDVGGIETRGGVKTFSPSSVLKQKLDDVEEGQLVRIEYQGRRTSKAGREYKAFEVLVAEGEGR